MKAAGRKTAKGRTGQDRQPGRRERKAAETRRALFRAALKLFSERGFSNVTVEDITEAADVGKGTFFNYFPTKDHVLGVMAEIQVGQIAEAVAQAVAGRRSIRGVFAQLSRHLAEEPGRSPALARTLVSSFLASEVVRGLIEDQMIRGRALVADLVEEGQRRGEIARELKKDLVALQFQQSMMGTILLWSLHGRPSLSIRIENSFEHFWRAVAAGREEHEQ
ncbi:MAG: TetR family transcriptional regulator [Terracidiphilus sp.]|nr:TetR family transcriptional regulator [Terracidiphilus sp.]